MSRRLGRQKSVKRKPQAPALERALFSPGGGVDSAPWMRSRRIGPAGLAEQKRNDHRPLELENDVSDAFEDAYAQTRIGSVLAGTATDEEAAQLAQEIGEGLAKALAAANNEQK